MSLEAISLAFGYPGRLVGAGLDLGLRRGETVCLLGPNGSGKTTLFRTLLGLIPPRAGRVLLDGRDLARWPRAEVARKLAYVPQAQQGVFPYSALEMVLMGRAARLGAFAAPGAKDRAAALAALERLGIAALAASDGTRLSGGQRQLVLIARALAQEAGFLVLDEPTASLDFGNQVLVLKEIGKLRAAGLGILLSTHAPDHAFACADRVLLLQGGRLVADGPPATAITAARLAEVYGVAVEIVRSPALGRPVCAPRLDG
jgi:iron complex transport system ATP-binding protein